MLHNEYSKQSNRIEDIKTFQGEIYYQRKVEQYIISEYEYDTSAIFRKVQILLDWLLKQASGFQVGLYPWTRDTTRQTDMFVEIVI